MTFKEKLTLREIGEYIVSKYPKSCAASNIHLDSYDDSIAIECAQFFYYECLKWCGCGSPEDAINTVVDLLKCLSHSYPQSREALAKRFGCNDLYDNTLLLCLAYSLYAGGMLEHGSSIGGAWITDEGQMFITCIDCLKKEYGEEYWS